MSFSREVKEELSRQISKGRHCQLAEIAGILGLSGRIESTGMRQALSVHTENITLARKYFTLLKNTFGINADIAVRQSGKFHKGRTCVVSIFGKEQILRVLNFHVIT